MYAGCPAPTAAPLPAMGVVERAMEVARGVLSPIEGSAAAGGIDLSTEGCLEPASLLAALLYLSTLLSLLGGRL